MTMTVNDIASEIARSSLPTCLFLGAGASIGSGAPSGKYLAMRLAESHLQPRDIGLPLSQVCARIEFTKGRRVLVNDVRSFLKDLAPTGVLKMLPDFNFHHIFTTNFDTLIETSFNEAGISVPIIRSNKDISFDTRKHNTIVYKVHGCMTEDVVDGHDSGMILTDTDYMRHNRFRQLVFNTLQTDLGSANVVFVGYSMGDPDIQEYVQKAFQIQFSYGGLGKIFVVQFDEDAIAAGLLERNGAKVAFGDLDKLLSALVSAKQAESAPAILSPISTKKPFEIAKFIATYDVNEEIRRAPNAEKMFTGGSVTYADIQRGYSFMRTESVSIVQQIANSYTRICVLLGSSGSGKTSAARIATYRLVTDHNFLGLEHKPHIAIDYTTWIDVHNDLVSHKRKCVFFLDEMSTYQFAINRLAEHIAQEKTEFGLYLIITAHQSVWRVRTKSPVFGSKAITRSLIGLSDSEIRGLLRLVDENKDIYNLVEPSFRGKSDREKIEFLRSKTNRDLFVCLKFLFDNRNLDLIVLQEFSQLSERAANWYKRTAYLEAIGGIVHRQLLLRLFDIDLTELGDVLTELESVVRQDDQEDGIYIWRTRHRRIAEIVTEAKLDEEERIELLRNVSLNLRPTLECELLFLRSMCNSKLGIESVRSLEIQNELLNNLIADAPGERVPHQRLIRNLMRLHNYGPAEFAISKAVSLAGNDSVISRYEVRMHLDRALHSDGLDEQDRIRMVRSAYERAIINMRERPKDKYCYENIAYAADKLASLTGKLEPLESALEMLKNSYKELLDDQIQDWVTTYSGNLRQYKINASSRHYRN